MGDAGNVIFAIKDELNETETAALNVHCHYAPRDEGMFRTFTYQHDLERDYPIKRHLHRQCFCDCDCTRNAGANGGCNTGTARTSTARPASSATKVSAATSTRTTSEGRLLRSRMSGFVGRAGRREPERFSKRQLRTFAHG